MQLKPERLASHLSGSLAPIYVVSGDEPLLVNEAVDAIRESARSRGYSERVVLEVAPGFDWGQLGAIGQSLSLFAENRIVDLRLPGGKPGDAGSKALAAYAAAPDPSTLLLVAASPLDGGARRSRWYRALQEAGVAVQIWPIPPDRLPAWIRDRMRAAGLAATGPACAELAQRVEGNLLACAQEIEKLRLVYGAGAVGLDEVIAATADSARFETFDLIDYTLDGNAGRTLRVLRGLRAEDISPLLVAGTLAWQLRTVAGMASKIARGSSFDEALRANPMWSRRRAGLRRALDRHPPGAWFGMMLALERIDRIAKGAAPGDPWHELEALCLDVCGISLGAADAHAS